MEIEVELPKREAKKKKQVTKSHVEELFDLIMDKGRHDLLEKTRDQDLLREFLVLVEKRQERLHKETIRLNDVSRILIAKARALVKELGGK